jgi:hypothetical protein
MLYNINIGFTRVLLEEKNLKKISSPVPLNAIAIVRQRFVRTSQKHYASQACE